MCRGWVWLNVLLSVCAILATGCASVQSFPGTARAGDTVAIAAGWKRHFDRDQLSVTIIPESGPPVSYLPGDPAVRAAINLYPDPLSSILVSPELGQDLTESARTYAYMVNYSFTDGDKDWWQSTVFLDLPADLVPGPTLVRIQGGQGEVVETTLRVIQGAGAPDPLLAESLGPMTSTQLQSLERVNHYTVAFAGDQLPYALDLVFAYQGFKLHVVNPRGDLKNLSWQDDGAGTLRVHILPSRVAGIAAWQDLKFYLAGGVKGFEEYGEVSLDGLTAYDADGNMIPGVAATVTSAR